MLCMVYVSARWIRHTSDGCDVKTISSATGCFKATVTGIYCMYASSSIRTTMIIFTRLLLALTWNNRSNRELQMCVNYNVIYDVTNELITSSHHRHHHYQHYGLAIDLFIFQPHRFVLPLTVHCQAFLVMSIQTTFPLGTTSYYCFIVVNTFSSFLLSSFLLPFLNGIPLHWRKNVISAVCILLHHFFYRPKITQIQFV